jgi:hypothetical protein
MLLVACSQQANKHIPAVINGTISDDRFDKVYLLEQSTTGTWQVLDSTTIVNKQFVFTHLPSDCKQVFIRLGTKTPFVVFVSPASIQLTIPAKNVHETVVQGSASHDEYVSLKDSIQLLLHQRLRFYKDAIIAQNDGRQNDAQRLLQQYNTSKNNVFEFLQKQKGANPNSAPLIYVIEMYKSYITDTEYTALTTVLP